MILVIATIRCSAGGRDALLAELERIVPQVRQEPGCLQYTPAVDLPTSLQVQQRVGQDAVVVVEAWEDLEALEKHLVAPHMVQYRQRVKDLVQEVRLQVLQPAIEPRGRCASGAGGAAP